MEDILLGNRKKRMVDLDTGEKIEVEYISKRAIGQKAFWKLYLADFLQVLDVIDSKQIDILIFILENTSPSTNTFIGTYEKIQNSVNVTSPTIAKVMKKLQKSGFIKKVQNGVWQISPRIMMKGNDHKKQILLNYYDDEIKNNFEPIMLEKIKDQQIKTN